MTDARRPARWVTIVIALGVAGVAVLVDQVSKAIAVAELSGGERIPLIGDLFGLQLAYNPGAVLSFGSGSTWIITIVATIASVVLVVMATRVRSVIAAVAVGLILGGAVGNLIDRLFAPPGFGVGHVIDFLAYGDWFIGNIADVVLGVGVVVALIAFALQQVDTRRRERVIETDSVDSEAGA